MESEWLLYLTRLNMSTFEMLSFHEIIRICRRCRTSSMYVCILTLPCKTINININYEYIRGCKSTTNLLNWYFQ